MSTSISHRTPPRVPSMDTSGHKLLTDEQKTAALSLRTAGWKTSRTAKHLNLNYHTIYQFYKRYDASGSKENAYSTSGNPKYSPQAIRNMVRSTQKDAQSRRSPLKDIGANNGGMSASTVARHLKQAGIESYKATRAPLLSPVNKQKRLQFALEHRSRSKEDWCKVLWTDESAISKQDSRHHHLPRRPQEKFHPACIQLTTKSGMIKVMVWGCFLGLQKGPLLKMPSGSIKSADFMDIMEEEVFCWFKGQPEDTIWMQDNAPIHTSAYSSKGFDLYGIKTLIWPAQSPDLNPIENLWAYLKHKLHQSSPHLYLLSGGPERVKEAIYQALLGAWDSIEEDYLDKLLESMPRRMEAVIQAKGGQTKY